MFSAVLPASEPHRAVPEGVKEVVHKKSLRGTSQAFLAYIPLVRAKNVSIRNNCLCVCGFVLFSPPRQAQEGCVREVASHARGVHSRLL